MPVATRFNASQFTQLEPAMLDAFEQDGYLILDNFFSDESCDALRASCLLYTSPSPRDGLLSRMPSSA